MASELWQDDIKDTQDILSTESVCNAISHAIDFRESCSYTSIFGVLWNGRNCRCNVHETKNAKVWKARKIGRNSASSYMTRHGHSVAFNLLDLESLVA